MFSSPSGSNAIKKYVHDAGERITTLRALTLVGRTALFSIAALLALDNVPGVKITTLVASLGIGGIAVAMALQNILGDIFASLSILLDKPFVVGDFIIVETHMGAVEYIGLKPPVSAVCPANSWSFPTVTCSRAASAITNAWPNGVWFFLSVWSIRRIMMP